MTTFCVHGIHTQYSEEIIVPLIRIFTIEAACLSCLWPRVPLQRVNFKSE